MSAVVDNLLTLARADADQVKMKRERVPLHEGVMSVFEALEGPARRKGVTLDLQQIEEFQQQGAARGVAVGHSEGPGGVRHGERQASRRNRSRQVPRRVVEPVSATDRGPFDAPAAGVEGKPSGTGAGPPRTP
jgi:signal transduction histidine kinase